MLAFWSLNHQICEKWSYKLIIKYVEVILQGIHYAKVYHF